MDIESRMPNDPLHLGAVRTALPQRDRTSIDAEIVINAATDRDGPSVARRDRRAEAQRHQHLRRLEARKLTPFGGMRRSRRRSCGHDRPGKKPYKTAAIGE